MEIRNSEHDICDFCSRPNPTRTFQCEDFPMDRSAGQPELRSTGAWLACSHCGTLIDNGNWNGLLLHAVDNLHEKYKAAMPRRVLTDTVRRSHEMFRQHYKGKSSEEAGQKNGSTSA